MKKTIRDVLAELANDSDTDDLTFDWDGAVDEALKELESIISEQVIGDNLPLPEEVSQTGTRLYNKIKEEEREALKAALYATSGDDKKKIGTVDPAN